MKIGRYVPVTRMLDAVRLSEENAYEVAEWVSGSVFSAMCDDCDTVLGIEVTTHANGDTLYIPVGYWVTKDCDSVSGMDDTTFLLRNHLVTNYDNDSFTNLQEANQSTLMATDVSGLAV